MITNVKGFRNLGNTCYMNSALQAMLSSNILNAVLLLYIKKNPRCIDSISPILIAYCQIIMDLLKNETDQQQYLGAGVYVPASFKNILANENPWFKGFKQHDSNELMVYLINEFADDKKDKGMSNLIKKVCFGKYKQYVWCTECKNVVTSYFKFLDILLPVPNIENPSLEDCFKKFAKIEKLDNDNKWMCPGCKKKVIAYKKMELSEVPEVAIFTLNRFRGTSKNITPVKIYQYIELEGKKLQLIATVNHYGDVGTGHYVSCVSRNNKWYMANDSSISDMNVESVLNNPSVYMVVYQVEN
jgi:ubiquitin C-terminal hydrolase